MHFAEATDHHVGRLEVAVDHAFGVGVGHRFADLEDHTQRSGERPVVLPGLACGRRLAVDEVDQLGEVAPLHELHREEEPPVSVEPELVDRNDARMLQLTVDLGLVEEARQRARVERLLRVDAEHFHGRGALQILVPDGEDATLAALGDLLLDAVALEGGSAPRQPPERRRYARFGIRKLVDRGPALFQRTKSLGQLGMRATKELEVDALSAASAREVARVDFVQLGSLRLGPHSNVGGGRPPSNELRTWGRTVRAARGLGSLRSSRSARRRR